MYIKLYSVWKRGNNDIMTLSDDRALATIPIYDLIALTLYMHPSIFLFCLFFFHIIGFFRNFSFLPKYILISVRLY